MNASMKLRLVSRCRTQVFVCVYIVIIDLAGMVYS